MGHCRTPPVYSLWFTPLLPMAFTGIVGGAASWNRGKWTVCACLLACCWNRVAFTDETKITAKPGDDVILPCRDTTESDMYGSEWRRPEHHGEVVFWLNGNLLFSHLLFKGRVYLKDPLVTDGDMSVVLKNVNLNDAGSYECYGKIDERFELISSIMLKISDPHQIRAKPGADVILPCQDTRAAAIDLLKWRKLDPEQNIFVWQKNISEYEYDDELHETFYGRVELKEPNMENGDVSVVLKNVSLNDSGTYECYIRDDSMVMHQLISTSILKVHNSEPDVESGNSWDKGKLVIVITVVLVAVVHLVGICSLIRRCAKQRRQDYFGQD